MIITMKESIRILKSLVKGGLSPRQMLDLSEELESTDHMTSKQLQSERFKNTVLKALDELDYRISD